LGSEDLVPWEHVDNSSSLVKRLKKDGFRIIAVEQSEGSVNYKKIKPTNKSVIILGNEVLGVSGSLLKVADVIAEVPLKGEKESLNVSVVAGIALFQIFG
jgi:23S rRNA (guanosine2251-2'-O)-methyltransferase